MQDFQGHFKKIVFVSREKRKKQTNVEVEQLPTQSLSQKALSNTQPLYKNNKSRFRRELINNNGRNNVGYGIVCTALFGGTIPSRVSPFASNNRMTPKALRNQT